uniref:Uncharacterized protein n=1 Tax=Oryza brachyantha TaxID=4533 RepID=J3KUN7_ORYBR
MNGERRERGGWTYLVAAHRTSTVRPKISAPRLPTAGAGAPLRPPDLALRRPICLSAARSTRRRRLRSAAPPDFRRRPSSIVVARSAVFLCCAAGREVKEGGNRRQWGEEEEGTRWTGDGARTNR